MNNKTKKIIDWSLTSVVGLIFIGSAMGKFFGGDSSVQMAEGIGLTLGSLRVLGIVELIGVLLFILPRTGILGTLILAAYMGGAIATHLTHGHKSCINQSFGDRGSYLDCCGGALPGVKGPDTPNRQLIPRDPAAKHPSPTDTARCLTKKNPSPKSQ
jgi:uncharacterized membrane protein YphA (DoxX/SURF4 family)